MEGERGSQSQSFSVFLLSARGFLCSLLGVVLRSDGLARPDAIDFHH